VSRDACLARSPAEVDDRKQLGELRPLPDDQVLGDTGRCECAPFDGDGPPHIKGTGGVGQQRVRLVPVMRTDATGDIEGIGSTVGDQRPFPQGVPQWARPGLGRFIHIATSAAMKRTPLMMCSSQNLI